MAERHLLLAVEPLRNDLPGAPDEESARQPRIGGNAEQVAPVVESLHEIDACIGPVGAHARRCQHEPRVLRMQVRQGQQLCRPHRECDRIVQLQTQGPTQSRGTSLRG